MDLEASHDLDDNTNITLRCAHSRACAVRSGDTRNEVLTARCLAFAPAFPPQLRRAQPGAVRQDALPPGQQHGDARGGAYHSSPHPGVSCRSARQFCKHVPDPFPTLSLSTSLQNVATQHWKVQLDHKLSAQDALEAVLEKGDDPRLAYIRTQDGVELRLEAPVRSDIAARASIRVQRTFDL